jgi:plastocyanin
MKLSIPFALVASAGLAFALDVPKDEHAQEGEHASCCAPAADGPVRFSYLELANPPGPGEVAGKVTGKVMFEGEERPKVDPLDITEKQSKGCTEDGSPVNSETRTVLISKEGGIQNCVIEISAKDAKLKLPEEPIELDQMQCRYEPHITLIPTGATVEFLNSDNVSHNVHTYATKNTPFNRTIGAGSRDTQKLEKSESIEVKCDIHPWMNSWMYVTDTPYATVSDKDGKFEIANLRPGEYKVEIWHEKFGKAKADVTVKEDGSSEMVEVKMGEEKGGGRRRRR